MTMDPDEHGVVTDIQRFSLHDGPGIRTTVFFQGCHLRCAWCHNPEALAMAPQLMFYATKCIGCRACVDACPHGVHSFTAAGEHVLDRDRCRGTGACVRSCPAGALALSGQQMTAADVVAQVLEDRAFYGAEGGVTLSGGEPVLQPRFAAAVLRGCRRAGIRTAVETSLCYPWARLEPLLGWVDLVMTDIKVVDAVAHRRYTGASNMQVWRNLRRIDQTSVPLIVRTPLVAGVNDGPDQMSQIVEKLRGLRNLRYYELLPYHPLGVAKYQALGCPGPDFRAPDADRTARLAALVRGAGIRVVVGGKEVCDEV